MRGFKSSGHAQKVHELGWCDRHRHDLIISSWFVESTVNYVTSTRFVKKQRMRWTQRGAHLLLQARTQILNNDLRKVFSR
jgi:hypothetical protein